MYSKVLVPLDGSKFSEKALSYARGLFRRLQVAEVIILHVYDPGDRNLTLMRQAYVSQAATVIKSGDGMIKATGEVVAGNPSEEILRYADKHDIDLIIMATHGRSGINRWAMGSVAYKVLRASNVPVWLVRAGVSEEIIEDRSASGKILVPLDGSREAEVVLPHVEALAKQWGAELVEVVLLRVCKPPAVSSDYPPDMPLSWEEHLEQETLKCKLEAGPYLAGVEKRLKQSGLRVSIKVLAGKPAEKISSYGDENDFSLITMVIHGRSGISRWAYGETAETVMLKAFTPIFLVRPQ
ncbi:MAG: universal stress protein [Dehalococcoidales bacterium]|nr:universal stress protein [Dehalococcoidales bacterium]